MCSVKDMKREPEEENFENCKKKKKKKKLRHKETKPNWAKR